MHSANWCILTRHTSSDNSCYQIYKISQNESLVQVMNHLSQAREIQFCYQYMDNVLESLYKHKYYYTEHWVVDYLLSFVVSYMALKDNPCHYFPFATFDELCCDLVVRKGITMAFSFSNNEKAIICDKSLENRRKRQIAERNLPITLCNRYNMNTRRH